MKKIFAVALLFLLIPAGVMAFSYRDILQFGKKIINTDRFAPEKLREAPAAESLPRPARERAEEKYENWKSAWDNNDIRPVFHDVGNFYFSEDEFNYLIQRRLKEDAKPLARDVVVNFEDGVIKASGYSLFKMMKGPFSVELTIVRGQRGRVNLKILKANLCGMYVPPFIVENILKSELKKTVEFLYGNGDYKNLDIVAGNGSLELIYAP